MQPQYYVKHPDGTYSPVDVPAAGVQPNRELMQLLGMSENDDAHDIMAMAAMRIKRLQAAGVQGDDIQQEGEQPFPQAWHHKQRIEVASAFLATYSDTNMGKLLDYEVQPVIRKLAAMIGQWQQAAVTPYLADNCALLDEPVQPDSGRDAALFDGPVDIPASISEKDRYMYLRGYHDAANKALAAHPAPSSDAAIADLPSPELWVYMDSMRMQRYHFGTKPENQPSARGYYSERSVKKIIAAHPANGAQAGDLTDEEISDIWRKLCAGGKSFGKGVGVIHIARAVLAAAKKGQ